MSTYIPCQVIISAVLYEIIKKDVFNKVTCAESFRRRGIKTRSCLKKAGFRQREVKCKGTSIQVCWPVRGTARRPAWLQQSERRADRG